jgi:hypothetical protein
MNAAKMPLLGHPRERGQHDQPGLPPEHLEHRRALDPVLLNDAAEDRRLQNAKPDVEPDPDHDNAEPERYAPPPGEKLVAGNPAEQQHH